ncbi:MAG TPA: hypothetical protein VKA44_06775, partial [Gemmatimonadota bacterium]|nr:hypothetical protein [Gemmatimonadota bacterium]
MDSPGDENSQIVFIPSEELDESEGDALDGAAAGGSLSAPGAAGETLPEGRLRLPVLPLRGTVVFPSVAAPIAAGR